MKLTGDLKDKVDQTANLEEAKDVIAKAGMLLTDDEVSEATGGVLLRGYTMCPYCYRNIEDSAYRMQVEACKPKEEESDED